MESIWPWPFIFCHFAIYVYLLLSCLLSQKVGNKFNKKQKISLIQNLPQILLVFEFWVFF